MEPVTEYQILFNISADRDDFFTENDWEYEDMMDELTKEGKLDDISQCVKKTYIWDDEIEQYVEDDVEILYDNILDETKKKTESKEKFNKAELQAVKQSIDTALDDLQLTASGTTGDYEDKLLRDELRDTSNFVGRYIGRMTESKMLEDGLDLSKIYSIQNYADVMTDKVIADMKYNERDKITIDDIINVIDDNINDTDIFSILCAEEREIYDKYFNEETIDELKDLWDNQSYAEEQFIDMVKDRVQKNGYTVYDEYNESKKVTENKKLTEGKYEDTLETNVAVKVLDYYTNTLGFDEDEAVDYFDTEVKSDKDTIEVEVRADLSYDDFDKLLPRLNRIVQTYDKEAYFDMVEPGIARAVIDKNAYNRDKHSKIKADKERYAKEVEEESKKTEAVELKPDGGDKTNYFMFYTDNYGGYKDNTADNIAQYGKEHLEGLKDLSLEEIKDKHLYWGTETGFNAFYNGDTYVLFDDIEKLPEDMKKDAYENCKGYSKKTESIEDKLQSYMNRMSYETKTIDDVKAIIKEMVKDDELDDRDLNWLFGHSVQPVLKERFNIDIPYEAEKQNMGTYEYIIRVYADGETLKAEGYSLGDDKESFDVYKHTAEFLNKVGKELEALGWKYNKQTYKFEKEDITIDMEAIQDNVNDLYIGSNKLKLSNLARDYSSYEDIGEDTGIIYYVSSKSDDYDARQLANRIDRCEVITQTESKKTETIDEVEDYEPYYVKEFNESGTDMDTTGFETEQEATDYAREQLKKRPNYEYAVYETETDECLYVYNSKDESKKKTESALVDLDPERYEEIKSKQVLDSDGFYNDYTMYYDKVNNSYVFVFGDIDLYEGTIDHEEENKEVAEEWFDDFDGFDDLEESKKVINEGSSSVTPANALLDLFNELYDGMGDMYAESEWAEILADDYAMDSETMEDSEIIITALNKMDKNAFRDEVDNFILGLYENDGIDYLKETLHIYPRNLKHIIQCLNTIKPYASEPDKIDNVIEELQSVNMDLRTTAEEFQRYLHDNYKPWTVLGSTSGPRTYVNLFEVPTEYDIVGADYFNFANRPSDMLENIGYGWKQDGDKIVADLIGYTHSVRGSSVVYDQAPVKYGYSATIDSSNKEEKFKEMANALISKAQEIKKEYKLESKKTEAIDTEEKAKEVKEKVEQDIQNKGTENLVDTTEELYDKLKKEIYAYAKQQGLDLEKLRKQGIELETIADTIDNVVGDMVSKTVIEYMDTTGKDIMWDFNISNNDIQVIIQ